MNVSIPSARILGWAVVIPIISLSLLFGCAPSARSSHGGYETVGKDPRRNTDLAQQKNTQAVALLNSAKYKDAEKVLKEVLDADVTYGPAHNNQGKVYYQEGQLYLAA